MMTCWGAEYLQDAEHTLSPQAPLPVIPDYQKGPIKAYTTTDRHSEFKLAQKYL